MRLPSRRRRSMARPGQRLSYGLLALAALAPTISQAISFEAVPSPNLDFSQLGRIGIVGDYTGISLYEFEGQNQDARSTNGSESLLAQLPNGAMASVVSTDASIRAMCMFKLSNGDMQGVVIGGNFTSLDGTQSTAIALFNPNTSAITPLAGLEGEVNALLCDQDRDTVYVGGNFKGANSTNAIAWYGTEGWTNLPFAGFNGPVNAITKASNGHIIFGGSFTGLGNASTPSEPDGQTINLSTANITADGSTSTTGFSDPKNIVCSSDTDGSGSTWLLEDDTPGAWQAKFSFGFEPTKLRLYNTNQDGRGTKTWRFIAYPINGIMNFTYVDPTTGDNLTCTSECPLSNGDVEYQDFHFVNRVGMNEFRIAISDWYGDGGGLDGIELFQDDIFAYAITKFNEPSCGVEFPSSATTTGPWKVSPSIESNSEYLTANLSGNDISPKSASVVFYPNIRESGNYSVNMYTPGCIPDDTCSTRGRVNVTGTMSTGTIDADFTTSLYQTNDYDKYDQIYFGYIEKTSDTFKPSVTLTPLANQDVDTLTIVAQRVGFTLINSTGGLNGLFDFNPEDAVVNVSTLEDSAINRLGASFDRSSGVASLVTSGDVIYVGGNFTSTDHENIVAINQNNQVKSLDGGLNGQVYEMYLNGTQLYVGGVFSNTQTNKVDGMDNVAVYDTDANSWSALGGGVDGPVEYVVPLNMNITQDTPELVISFTGQFTTCNAFDNTSATTVDGFAIWVPSQSNWLQNLEGDFPIYSGVLTAALLDLPDDDSIFAGSISSAQLGANGAVTLSDAGLGQFGVKLQTSSASSNSSKFTRRDTTSIEDTSGVVTGIFFEEDNQNITILAGHFTATASNGSEVENLVMVDGSGTVSGLGSDISSDSTFVTLAIRDNTLFAGGKVSGSIGENNVRGLISYNLNSKSFNTQPPGVTGSNGTVSAIAVQPNSANVYVGGSFENAGALDCPGLCVYDVDSNQWNRPGSDVEGDVYTLLWTSKTNLVIGGSLGSGNNKVYLANWDAKKETLTNYPDSDSIPGPVQALAPASSNADELWISGTSAKNGSVYLMKYDGSKWLTANPALSSDTIVQGLQVFSVTEGHEDTDMLDKKQVLMLTGSIVVPGFGVASAAIFNGTTYQPYALTTGSGSSTGSISKIFSQKDNFFSSEGKHMPLVFVVLIGLAISLGLMLLLVLAGIVLDRLRKKREGYVPAPTSMYDRGSGIQRIPPHELLESLRQGGAPRV